MKHNIIINLSKDTPAETFSALYAVLKVQNEKRKLPLYLTNEDIEKLNERYENLYKKVKDSQNLSTAQVNRECEILLEKYNFEIEELSAMRKVDYDIRLAEIKARAEEVRPVRYRHWYWLFKTFPNRAQAIIDERAELDAARIHGDLEKSLDEDWKKLQESEDKKFKRLKKQQRKVTGATQDETPAEPPVSELPTDTPATRSDVQTVQENASKPAKQLPGQMTLDDVQAQEQSRPAVPFTAARPRPPRSCRKQ